MNFTAKGKNFVQKTNNKKTKKEEKNGSAVFGVRAVNSRGQNFDFGNDFNVKRHDD